MNIKKVFQNAVFRFLISYLLVLVVPMLIVSMGFQVAFRIVENNLKVTHINMLQRSADVIENELLDMETLALQVANASSILDMAGRNRGDENYIMTALDALDDFTLYLNYRDIELMKSQSAYIYFRNTDLVMFEKSYYTPEIFKTYLEKWGISYEEWREEMQNPELVAPEFGRMGEGFAYVFPFSKRMFGERQGVIVF